MLENIGVHLLGFLLILNGVVALGALGFYIYSDIGERNGKD